MLCILYVLVDVLAVVLNVLVFGYELVKGRLGLNLLARALFDQLVVFIELGNKRVD